MKVMVTPIVIGVLGTILGTRSGGHGNNGTGGECLNYSIVEIGQNTEKSPGDLRRFAVTQTEKPSANAQVKNSQGVK